MPKFKKRGGYREMRALCIADLHLNYDNRFSDFVETLRQIAQYAIQRKVQALLIAGDVYQRRRPSSLEKNKFEAFVRALVKQGILVYIIPGLKGKHDLEDNISTVEEFKTLEIKGVIILPNPSIIKLGDYKIFLGHLLLKEAKLGPLAYSINEGISVNKLIEQYSADIYIIGHVHTPQLILDNPPVLYCGSIDRVDFGERNETKGMIFIDTNQKDKKYRFIPLKIRPMKQIDITDDWLKEQSTFDVKDAIVKIVIHTTKEKIRQYKEPQIRHAFASAYKIKSIIFDIKKEEIARDRNINESLSPLKAFQEYTKKKNLPKEVIELGEKIIIEGGE